MTRFCGLVIGLGVVAILANVGSAETESSAAERGKKALVERSFSPAVWTKRAYTQAWRQWKDGSTEAPRDYDRVFREHYGLHPSPFPNPYPLGMRPVRGILGAGISTDCMLCHGGSIAGQSYIGLGNTTLDMQSLYEDMSAADGRSPTTPFVFGNTRGTVEAGSMAVFLLAWRTPDLKLRPSSLDFPIHEYLCEDVPAWWLLKKKKSMYYTGGANARSVRSLMQFMMSPLNSASAIKQEESTFRDIQAFILNLKPPRYPFSIDTALAHRGEDVFLKTCARCHGTYGDDWTYPNRVVALDVIGTDRTRYDGICMEAGRYYNTSWFAHEHSGWLSDDYPARLTVGYQAPPLDGIWATAPYLHNGSVPTVYNMLNSRTRPEIFTRAFRTDAENYDPVKLGWKIQPVDSANASPVSPYERRKIYDTRLPGRGNHGHTFGDGLSEPDRMAVIEYLKTL